MLKHGRYSLGKAQPFRGRCGPWPSVLRPIEVTLVPLQSRLCAALPGHPVVIALKSCQSLEKRGEGLGPSLLVSWGGSSALYFLSSSSCKSAFSHSGFLPHVFSQSDSLAGVVFLRLPLTSPLSLLSSNLAGSRRVARHLSSQVPQMDGLDSRFKSNPKRKFFP